MLEVLREWKEAFGKHVLKISLEKTEVMLIGQQRKYMNIMLEGKAGNIMRQGNRFEYLGGIVMGW